MPIYEYRCGDCDKFQEHIVLGAESPNCVACGSDNLKKQFSVFASPTKAGSLSAPTMTTQAPDHAHTSGCAHHHETQGSCQGSRADDLVKQAEKEGII